MSFKFSEWSVQSVSHDFRVVILYRPQADSGAHKIPMSIFSANSVTTWKPSS